MNEAHGGADLFDCSALISSEVADLYLRCVTVVPNQENLALCIFPADELIPLCVIAEFPSEEAVGSSQPVSAQSPVPLHTPALRGSCFLCVLRGLPVFWKWVAYSLVYTLIFGCECVGISNTQ